MAKSEQRDHWVRIETGELRAVIGDNDSDPPGAPWSHKGDRPLPAGLRHHPGYNGVWSLTSVHAPANLFTEPFAGLNYEFIFDGELQDAERRHSFAPRFTPTSIKVTGEDAVAFHQQPTERRRVEAWWTIELTEPHYIDLTFSCVPHASPPHGWLTIFFANYVWRPDRPWMWLPTDKGVRERPRSRERPNSVAPSGSPVLPTRAAWKEGWLNRDPDFPLALPYFFGRPSVTPGDEGMVFMVMLDTDGVPGFAQPAPLEEPFDNAPWDFHVTFPRVHAGERHGFRARLVYARRSGPEACRAEYERWLGYSAPSDDSMSRTL